MSADVIQDQVEIDSVAVVNDDAGFDHAVLYCFVVQSIYLKFEKMDNELDWNLLENDFVFFFRIVQDYFF